MKYSLPVPGKAIDIALGSTVNGERSKVNGERSKVSEESSMLNVELDLISSRPSEMGTRTKLDEVVEAGLSIFGGKKL